MATLRTGRIAQVDGSGMGEPAGPDAAEACATTRSSDVASKTSFRRTPPPQVHESVGRARNPPPPLNVEMLERPSTWRARALRRPLFCPPMTPLLSKSKRFFTYRFYSQTGATPRAYGRLGGIASARLPRTYWHSGGRHKAEHLAGPN